MMFAFPTVDKVRCDCLNKSIALNLQDEQFNFITGPNNSCRHTGTSLLLLIMELWQI